MSEDVAAVAAEWDSYQSIDAIQDAVREVFGPQFAGQFSSITPEYLADLGRRLGITAGTAVLDLGCGTGGLTMSLAAATGCRAVGVDISPQAVAIASAQTGVGSERCQYITGDMQSPPVSAGLYEVILALGSAYWSDPGRAIPRWVDLLTEDGRIAFLLTRIHRPWTRLDQELTLQEGLFEPHRDWEGELRRHGFDVKLRSLSAVAGEHYRKLAAALGRRRCLLGNEMGIARAERYIQEVERMSAFYEAGHLSRIEIVAIRNRDTP